MEISRGFPSGPKGFGCWISYLTWPKSLWIVSLYSQDVRGGNTFVKFHEHDPRNIIHMMIGHDTQWSKAPSCKRQATKGCITEFVFYFYLRNGTLIVRICRIISNPGYYTSKNHLDSRSMSGRTELHQAAACLDTHGSSCTSHQMLHSSFCQSHENFIFHSRKDVPWWVATLLAKHTHRRRGQPPSCRWFVLSTRWNKHSHMSCPPRFHGGGFKKRSRNLIIHSSMLVIYLV